MPQPGILKCHLRKNDPGVQEAVFAALVEHVTRFFVFFFHHDFEDAPPAILEPVHVMHVSHREEQVTTNKSKRMELMRIIGWNET